jgi:predicted TIM-barrel fold metal-dependent hydrolase
VGAIDVWCNLYNEQGLAMYNDPEVKTVVDWWGMHDRIKAVTTAEFLSRLDEAAIDHVLIPATRMRSYMHGHMMGYVSYDDLAATVAEAPDRFHGMAGINPMERMHGVRELERSVKELGFVGAHLHIYGFGIPINDRLLYPYYAKCAELGIPVMMQIGHSAEFMPSEMGRPIHLDTIALDFPEVNFVAAHTGWPWVEELIALAWKHRNVYIATTAHAPRYWDPKLVDYINTRGRDRVMFGTDYPVLGHKECMEQVEELGLREKSKKRLLRDNAAELFRLP